MEEGIGVTDGARTHDNLSHSQGLYQLSYSHHTFLLGHPYPSCHHFRNPFATL